MTLWKTSITSTLLEIGNSFFHTRWARLRGVFSSNKTIRSHLTVMTLWFWQVVEQCYVQNHFRSIRQCAGFRVIFFLIAQVSFFDRHTFLYRYIIGKIQEMCSKCKQLSCFSSIFRVSCLIPDYRITCHLTKSLTKQVVFPVVLHNMLHVFIMT